ncbi:MAG: hypothetical protein AVDCRST_MAG30-3765, partial [uncultured Solirubrobacteraceae bacterium]
DGCHARRRVRPGRRGRPVPGPVRRRGAAGAGHPGGRGRGRHADEPGRAGGHAHAGGRRAA